MPEEQSFWTRRVASVLSSCPVVALALFSKSCFCRSVGDSLQVLPESIGIVEVTAAFQISAQDLVELCHISE